MRKLAERAQEATGRIQSIVTEIQSETNATILASEQGSARVKQGVDLARDVVEALDRIAGMVDETTTATQEISVATQQQRSASDQVVVAMTQVTDASRQYAVGSRQTASSAEELASVAVRMRGSIATLQRRGQGGRRRARRSPRLAPSPTDERGPRRGIGAWRTV